jgi:uncharacterized short protein YbdD (DUF466 family)
MKARRARLPAVATAVRTGARGVLWYLRELTGENGYARYLEHQRRAHPGVPVMSRREFERYRTERSARPGARCC